MEKNEHYKPCCEFCWHKIINDFIFLSRSLWRKKIVNFTTDKGNSWPIAEFSLKKITANYWRNPWFFQYRLVKLALCFPRRLTKFAIFFNDRLTKFMTFFLRPFNEIREFFRNRFTKFIIFLQSFDEIPVFFFRSRLTKFAID